MDENSVNQTPTSQAYSELQEAFNFFNERLFDGELPHVLITMQRDPRTKGYFSPEQFAHRSGDKAKLADEIAMNPSYFATATQMDILATLVHEMCHAWQFKCGTPSRRGYHNTEWAAKMEEVGLMPSNTGRPGGSRTGEKMSHYPIEDGPFTRAAAELIDGGFQVTWLDRSIPSVELLEPEQDEEPEADGGLDAAGEPVHQQVPPSEETPEPVLGQHEAEGQSRGNGPVPPSLAEEPTEPPPAPQAQPLEPFESSNPAALAPAGGDARSSVLEIAGRRLEQLPHTEAYRDLLKLPSEQRTNRTNRDKYECPRCKARVWGKPNLVILCGGDSCESARFAVSA